VRVKLDTKDILFIRSEGNYIEIILKNKKHLIRTRLTDFLKELPEENFVQVHRRYIIHKNKIDFLGNGFLTINNTEIPISKTFKDKFEKQINIL
jgi:DNA-binding LytR/AlgR family response regulator